MEWTAVCLILGFFRVLPRRVADAAALAVVSLLRLSVRRYTRVARRNLAIAFPDLDEATEAGLSRRVLPQHRACCGGSGEVPAHQQKKRADMDPL